MSRARLPACVAVAGAGTMGAGMAAVLARAGTWLGHPLAAAALVTALPAGAAPERPGFRDGIYRVGTDIRPETYRNGGDTTSCYWARLRNFSGSLMRSSPTTTPSEPAVVTIPRSDKGFETSRCGLEARPDPRHQEQDKLCGGNLRHRRRHSSLGLTAAAVNSTRCPTAVAALCAGLACRLVRCRPVTVRGVGIVLCCCSPLALTHPFT